MRKVKFHAAVFFYKNVIYYTERSFRGWQGRNWYLLGGGFRLSRWSAGGSKSQKADEGSGSWGLPISWVRVEAPAKIDLGMPMPVGLRPIGLRFWATVCKTVCPMLSVRCLSVLSCPVLSVCDVGVL